MDIIFKDNFLERYEKLTDINSFKEITVKDVTPDNEIYYTVLELTEKGMKLTLNIKDTASKTVEDWLKSSEAPKDLKLYGATSLGETAATQYADDSKLYTVAIDQGVLYFIEGPKDGGFWEEDSRTTF